MQEFQTHQLVDRIIELDERHVAIARSLLSIMSIDDPEVADTWLELAAAERDGLDPQGMIIVPRTVFDALHSHVRYGYVVEWLAKWSVESFQMKSELAARLPCGWDDVDGVLTAEYGRRTS